ncbi:MAG: polysaccharide pyruvyl transferase family protein [Candidatus Thorarchaeota archaeon]
MSTDNIKILVAEWIPSLNKGEMAIFLGMLETFRILNGFEVTAFSFLPEIDALRYPQNVSIVNARDDLLLGGSLFRKSFKDRLKLVLFPLIQHLLFILFYLFLHKRALKIFRKPIWKSYDEADVIMICHNQISCVFGFVLLYSPLYITLVAKALNKPLVIYGNGTPPLHGRLTRMMARFVLDSACLTTTREEETYRILKSISPDNHRIIATADPAVLAIPSSQQRAKLVLAEEGIIESQTLLVGVTLSKSILLKSFQLNLGPVKGFEIGIIQYAELFDRLIDERGVEIVFLPHCIEPYEMRDDRQVSHRIFNAMRRKSKAHLINKEYSLEDLKAVIRELDLLVSARIHSAIGALTTGVPSCILAESIDIRALGLIGGLLQQGDWIYHVENFDSNDLLNCIGKLIERRESIREDLKSIIPSVERKAMKNGKLLASILGVQFDA